MTCHFCSADSQAAAGGAGAAVQQLFAAGRPHPEPRRVRPDVCVYSAEQGRAADPAGLGADPHPEGV
jgi:hypothetical protein